MATGLHIPPAALYDAAFTLLEQYVQGMITDTTALTKIDVKLYVVGIPFVQGEWLDLMEVIVMNGSDGLNSIKAAWQLMQATTTPLQDAATWQVVLRWAADDTFSFNDFLTEMVDKFKERYRFNDWEAIFDQVFEASCKGTAVEVVRAAMAQHGVLDRPGHVSCALPPSQISSLQTYMSALEDNEDEDERVDESDQDNEVDRRPRVTDIGPSGCETFDQCLQGLIHRYGHEGTAERPDPSVHQTPVDKADVGMDVGKDQMEMRVYMIELPSTRAAGFVSAHLKCRGMHCQTYCSLPRCIFVDTHNPLEVRVSLPPSHDTLVKDIMWIPTEELLSITQLCNIPICSWVCILSGTFKHDIAYVLSIEDNSMEMLVVPRSLPYWPDFHVGGCSLFNIDLATDLALAVTISTDDQGHPIMYCEGEEYVCSCMRIRFPKKKVKIVSVLSPGEITWFSLASVDPSLVDCTLAHFSAQWWQDRDIGRICSGEFADMLAHIVTMDGQFPKALEVSIYDVKLEFPIGASIKVIVGLGCGFQGIVISKLDDMFVLQGHDQQVPGIFLMTHLSPTVYTSQDPHDQLQYDPLANEDKIQPGDLVTVVSGPHKGITGTLYYYSGHEMLITVLTRQQKDTDDLGAKGKSKAWALKVADGNDDIDEDSNSLQVSVSIDDATVIPPPTLQFSMEKGYDVTVRDYCCLKKVHCTLLSSGFCLKVRDYSLQDAELPGGLHEVWIISSPNKGYRGTLWSVVTESGMLLNGAPLDATRMAAFIDLCWSSYVWAAPLPRHATPPPVIAICSSTSVYDPWVVQPDDLTPQWPNEAEQQLVDECGMYVSESACPTIAVHCTSEVVRTMAPDHFSTIEDGPAPPSHIAVMVTSSTVSANIERHFVPTRYLTPANLTSTGQYCLVLQGTLAGQIFWVKKCQSKKEPKGIELNGGAKLLFGDTQSASFLTILCGSKDDARDMLTSPPCHIQCYLRLWPLQELLSKQVTPATEIMQHISTSSIDSIFQVLKDPHSSYCPSTAQDELSYRRLQANLPDEEFAVAQKVCGRLHGVPSGFQELVQHIPALALGAVWHIHPQMFYRASCRPGFEAIQCVTQQDPLPVKLAISSPDTAFRQLDPIR
ncbi:hypothetical protein EDD16DRAFT_1522228 [Pisolithus croceorrhizus]|nr:hypothetical protein EDD16DRAFT_1522228 [Pisolithus croceorrhizus]